MMDKCLPALIASALFFTLILWDIISKKYYRMPGHFLFGLFIILTFLVLCSKGFEYVGWIIIALPVILIAAGYVSSNKVSTNIATPVASTELRGSTGCIKLAPQPSTGCTGPFSPSPTTECPEPVESSCNSCSSSC